ncbi:MAG TPA: hypothetical protein VFC99_07130, partial [Acidimicrobiia bacterium]|nr:hypothetical protein [Acidimicrobiia bacterium]
SGVPDSCRGSGWGTASRPSTVRDVTDHELAFDSKIERSTHDHVDFDVTISAEVATLHRVWLGREPITQAVRAGGLAFDGPRALTSRMADVLQLSQMADVVRASM